MKDVNELIDMLPEDKEDEVLKSAESRPKGENSGAVIYQLVMSFMVINTSRRKKYEVIRVKRLDRLIHESINWRHVHEYFFKGRYKEICREGGEDHGKRV